MSRLVLKVRIDNYGVVLYNINVGISQPRGGAEMKYRCDTECLELSCEELCTLAYRRGNSPLVGIERPASSAALKRISSESKEEYNSNVMVCATVKRGGISYKLSADIDGIYESHGVWNVDFVKEVGKNELQKDIPQSIIAYVKYCSFLVCEKQKVSSVIANIILCCNDEGSVTQKRISQRYFRDDLAVFLDFEIAKIRKYTEFEIQHEKSVRKGAASVIFPYNDIREGQDELIHKAMSVIRKGQRLFAQAPTGIGKTMSMLYPSVISLGKGLCDKIFYLTAKSSTAREAYNATARLCKAGARIRSIVISSKEQMCCLMNAKNSSCGKYCNPHDCPYARGYYDRVDGAISELLAGHNGYYADLITETALKHSICPYELSLDISEFCDVIICDYNYIFDPIIHFKRYLGENNDRFGKYVFLVDEAHNLADRAREMFSVTLSQNRIEETAALIFEVCKDLADPFEKLLVSIRKLKSLCKDTMRTDSELGQAGYYISKNLLADVGDSIEYSEKKLSQWKNKNRNHELYDVVNGVHSELRKYCVIQGYYDEKFITYVETSSEDTTLSLNCIDPSDVLDDRMDRARATLMFSATLTPTSYFSDILGGGKRSVCIELASPYDPQNLCIAAVDKISTRFEDRDSTYKRISSCIAAAVSARAGNYIVYFPSYSLLEKVHGQFSKKYPAVKTILQKRKMSPAEREEFISSFKDDVGKMRIGFCVLGGIFSEGLDFPGTRLIGSVIVGVGLPGFSSERNIMRDYFETKYENGFDYAYTYPGMNSVLQAAGRVIRCEQDKGIVVLIDDRYSTPTYQKLFPQHWQHLKYAGNSSSLAEIVRNFWENKD